MAKHIITKSEYQEVLLLSKANKLKRVDKRLQVIILRYQGLSHFDIAIKLGYNPKSNWVSKLIANFKEVGAKEYAKHKYGGNNQAVDTVKENPHEPLFATVNETVARWQYLKYGKSSIFFGIRTRKENWDALLRRATYCLSRKSGKRTHSKM